MGKIALTSEEFLSLYTGYVLGDDFNVVKSALKKVYGYDPFDENSGILNPEEVTIQLQKQFHEYIDQNYNELAQAAQELGAFKSNGGDVKKEVKEYVDNFENMAGIVDVEIEPIKKAVKNKTNQPKEQEMGK